MRARATAVALLLLVGGVAACGGDDDGGGEQSKEAFCDLNGQIDDAFTEAFADFDENSTPQDIEDASAEVASEVQDIVEEAQEVAPDEIADDVEVLANAVDEAADGDMTAFEGADVEEAGNNVDEYCGTADEGE